MRSIVRELIETVLLALLLFLAMQFSVQNFRVEGSSMKPVLEEGNYVFVNKVVYSRIASNALLRQLPFIEPDREEDLFLFQAPKLGEIMIFRFPRDPSRDFVKRVIGVPGDVVSIKRGQVIVNDEPYVTHGDLDNMPATIIPRNSFFVMGDNRRSSNDSRDWGVVPSEFIVGKAWLRYWPLDRLNAIP